MSDESDLNRVARTLTTQTEKAPPEPSSRFHLYEILASLKSVMVICSATGKLEVAHARPMSIARADTDGTLFFLAPEDSELVRAIRRGDVGMCTGQTKTQFVSVEGRFEVIYDPATIELLWTKGADIWFPKGKTDPRVRVVIFRPAAAEIWDMSGSRGLNFLLDVAKAWMMGEQPPENREVHSKIIP